MSSHREKSLKSTRAFFRSGLGLGCLALLVVTSGCGSSTPKDTRAADEATLRALDAQWAKSVAGKDLDATVGYYSDDASLMAPNAPIATDKQSIRDGWSGILSPGIALTWQATKVDVARSGDLAYIIGPYQMINSNAKDKSGADRGKFLEVWKKQTDGSWRVVADIFNSDLPLATPPAAGPMKKGSKKITRGKKKSRSHSHTSGM